MKNSSRSNDYRGFTLLEMVFAMLLLVVLTGISFAGVSYLWKGEKVENSARKMQSVMMHALRLSVANQEPYAVVLDARQLRLIPAKEVLLLADEDGVVDREGEDADNGGGIIKQVTIPLGVEVFIHRWLEEDWKAVEQEILDFPVSGICEPVRFRLVSGGDVFEFSLHPLTAYPTDESLLVQ